MTLWRDAASLWQPPKKGAREVNSPTSPFSLLPSPARVSMVPNSKTEARMPIHAFRGRAGWSQVDLDQRVGGKYLHSAPWYLVCSLHAALSHRPL